MSTEETTVVIPITGVDVAKQFARSCKRNVVMMGISFLVVLTAYCTVQAFMTTINQELGYLSLAIVYGTLSVCLFFSPTVEVCICYQLAATCCVMY